MSAPPPEERDWIAVTDQVLPVAEALLWTTLPGCGGVVTFCGTVRDHSEGRPGVTSLEYEAHPEHVVPRLADVASAARRQWPMLGRLALLHRVGRLEVGEISVVVVASTPHRAEAFEAARFCIDTLKHTAPIWKRETWLEGAGWSACSYEIEDVPGGDRTVPSTRP
ncbi:MAG TPA: molybdenum cofactor biosynthesis protein MoaE [Acidimicrobiales bacterium]|jgi:molybdopterin synthase catalytic subunit